MTARSTAATILAAASISMAAPIPTAAASPPTPPTPSTPAAKRPAVAASNAFGIDLYRTLAADTPASNLFLSPYSMSIALTMAAEGARGQTEAEMARTLHFPPIAASSGRSITPVHAGYSALAASFRAAAGTADPKTRERIETLHRQLEQANAKVDSLQNKENWSAARAAAETAQRLAAELNTLLPTVDRFDLRIANALWVEQSFPLIPDYIATIDRYYGAGGVSPLDIIHNPERSRQRINGWVEDNTERRIRNLLPPGSLDADTRLVITNAVYFKGQWADPFEEGSTRDEPFTRADGTTITVRMMRDGWRGNVPYAAFTGAGEYFDTPREVPRDEALRPATYPDEAGFQMIELPYKGGDLAMVLIAPRSPGGLTALESTLTTESLDAWLAKFDRRAVDTALPRFKLEGEYDMADPLQALGMKRAFVSTDQPNGAEFPGITDGPNPSQQVYIGAVRHKAWVEVNEKGTEAAAATAVIGAVGAAARPVEMIPFTPQFRADRPFLFLIRDTKSGLILFMGRMTNPSA